MSEQVWPSAIVLVDMNCFFAAVEQLDNPMWRRQPVAVTNGLLGTTIITSSYEARAFGIKTGMRLNVARTLCPNLIQAPSRPNRYAELSTDIMASLQQISPDIEVYSIDEAFIEVTHCQSLLGSPYQIAKRVKKAVYQASGLYCSVGVSGDKTTAKFAAKRRKPNGLMLIPPWQAEETLAPYPITELSGINTGVAGFLRQYGVIVCGDMKKLPIGVLAQRYGNIGRRIWLMAQGQDPEKVRTNITAPKTMGHGKNMPPETKDLHIILTYFQHMSEKLAARLRQYGYQSNHFMIALKTKSHGWITNKSATAYPTDDGKQIFALCQGFMTEHWHGQGGWQVRVVALNVQSEQQTDLFQPMDLSPKREKLNLAVDEINHKFGEFTVAPSRLIKRSEMPNVITPSWQPSGHRKTV
ncbi:MAG: DNA polymerase IV [Piscirickettsiaceae bacterium]|jgi:DNA polymerase IV|nr:DNA polymerase IV [Piscirickettsiaceae bacterium]